MNTNFKISMLMFVFLLPVLLCAKPVVVDGLKSAVVPGWGEISNGNNTGYVFFSAEILLWASKYYFDNEAKLKIRQSEQFAINNANLANFDMNNIKWTLLEKYDHSGTGPGGYNAKVESDAKTRYPDDPDAQIKYINDNKIDEESSWDWENSENRRKYRIMKKDSLHNKDFALAVSGVIIVNHIVSFFHSIRVANNLKRVEVFTSFDNEMTPYINCVINF